MPPRLIEDEYRVRARTDLLRDFSEMQAHRSAVASWHDEPRTLAITRTDRAENVGGGGALIVWGRRPCPTPGPAPRNLVLLTDTCFVRKPHLYGGCIDSFLLRDLLQAAGKAYGMARPSFRRVPSPEIRMKERNMEVAVLGIDLGKNVCSIVGLDGSGAVGLRRRIRRDKL